MMELNKILLGDCLKLMPSLPDKSIDMILCDLPYGTTACTWDVIIPFEPLWEQYKRIIKDNGAIVLTASQPFTSMLVMSNIKMFKQELVFEKRRVGHLLSKKRFMQQHENILIFYKNQPTFNPNKTERTISEKKRIGNIYKTINSNQKTTNSEHYIIQKKLDENYDKNFKYDGTIIICGCLNNTSNRLHPTQKPVALFEYLIKTYTNEGETVLDNCAGSFTTAIACINTNRNYICMEDKEKFFNIGKKRIEDHLAQLKLF